RLKEFTYNIETPDIFTAPLGIYEELVKNKDGAYSLTKRDGTKYDFDVEGKLSSIVDRNGNAINFKYTASKLPIIGHSEYFNNKIIGVLALDYQLIQVTDSVGRDYQINYNEDGRISSIVDYAGRTWIFTYENDNLKSVTTPTTPQYPSGLITIYTYDSKHNLESVTDPKGQTFLTNHYDSYDRVISQNYGQGSSNIVYDLTNKKTTISDFKGHVTEWTYNAMAHLIQRTDFRPDDPISGYTTTWTYTDKMEVAQVTYPKGNGTIFTYNINNTNPRSRGNLLQIRRKTNMAAIEDTTNDIATNFTYETQFNQVKTMTDQKGNVTAYTYDYELSSDDLRYGTKGNLVKLDEPSLNERSPTTWFRHNSYGQITEVQDPDNIITEYTYFPSTGQLQYVKQTVTGMNTVTQMTYDIFGNLDTWTNALMHTTDLNYNELGWLIEEISPQGYKTKYTYDENSNVTKVERQSDTAEKQWQTTNFTYNTFGHVETITDPLNRVITLGYDK
ncbi:MAG: RHS repeat protein, partial [Candidatus Omnitrophica bacterium]|nr:RHS repeat protein [Candidatus Omnitrophota bacterium]